jgi:hypothetical protein
MKWVDFALCRFAFDTNAPRTATLGNVQQKGRQPQPTSGEVHRNPTMPLTRFKDEYLEQDGVRFLMVDEDGTPVTCRVSHEALRDHADRVHLSGTNGAVFEAYRELIEEVASAAYDAEGPLDDHGRVLVTSEALARITRSA